MDRNNVPHSFLQRSQCRCPSETRCVVALCAGKGQEQGVIHGQLAGAGESSCGSQRRGHPSFCAEQSARGGWPGTLQDGALHSPGPQRQPVSGGPLSRDPAALLPSWPPVHREDPPSRFVLPPPPGKGLPPLVVALFSSHSVSWLYSSLVSCHTRLFVSSPHSSNDIFLVPSVSSKLRARPFVPPHLFSYKKKKRKKERHLIWI